MKAAPVTPPGLAYLFASAQNIAKNIEERDMAIYSTYSKSQTAALVAMRQPHQEPCPIYKSIVGAPLVLGSIASTVTPWRRVV